RVPVGVELHRLRTHRDPRGSFTEVFRQEWDVDLAPVQWNAVHSEAGTLRGVHVHVHHDDYLVVLKGRASVGLRDLREGSPTQRRSVLLELDEDSLSALVIPHGVAHGFYFHESSVHLY